MSYRTLHKNSALAEEVRRSFVDLDEIEKELKKAANAVGMVSSLTAKYRGRLQALCDNGSPRPPQRDLGGVCQTTA